MSIRIEKDQIPIGQIGSWGVDIEVLEPRRPLQLEVPKLFAVASAVNASDKWSWGGDASAKLAVDGNTSVDLLILSDQTMEAQKAVLKRYGLSEFLTTGVPVLLLEVGADAGLSASGSFRYGVLKAGVTLKAGADGCAGWARPFDPKAPAEKALLRFFKGLALPADMAVAPAPGEVTVFEYSGDLKLSASVSAGLEVKGTASTELSHLKVSEHYKASAMGKLTVSAGLSGLFSVEVRQAARADGTPMEGWARVIVKRSRSKAFSASADLNIGVEWQSDGVPADRKALFGALLGVEAGNWIHWADNLAKLGDGPLDAAALEAKVDALGKDFFQAWVGKNLSVLLTPEKQAILDRIREVVDTYNNAGAQAQAVLDSYVDQGDLAVDNLLSQLQGAASWDRLQGKVSPELWDLVNRLTAGDPLGWTLKKIPDGQGGHLPTLDDLKALAASTAGQAKALLKTELGAFLGKAKKAFGLDPLMETLGTWSDPQQMASALGSKAGHFLSRILGESVEKIPTDKQGELWERLQKIQKGYAAAGGALDGLLAQAAKGDLEIALGAAYSRADEKTALVDVAFNMAREEGKALFRKAVLGDFAGLLSEGLPVPGLWQINTGTFTRKLLTKRSFKVNIMGWHDGFKYQSSEQLLVNCTQHITAGKGGAVLVQTRLSAEAKSDKIRPGEERHAKFALVLAAVTQPGAESLGYDKDEQAFLFQGLQAQSSSYTLLQKDNETTEKELREYLAFAQTLGLAEVGATFEALAPLMLRTQHGVGRVALSYTVRFKKATLQRLFAKEFAPEQLRQVIGELVLAHFAGDKTLSPVAWAFYFHLRHEDWEATPNSHDLSRGVRWPDVRARLVCGFHSPRSIFVDSTLMNDLVAFYGMERDLIEAWTDLSELIRSGQAQKPSKLLAALEAFFKRCRTLAGFARIPNFLLAFFDGLAALDAPENENRASSLQLSFTGADGSPQDKKMIFALALGADEGEDPEEDQDPLSEEG